MSALSQSKCFPSQIFDCMSLRAVHFTRQVVIMGLALPTLIVAPAVSCDDWAGLVFLRH